MSSRYAIRCAALAGAASVLGLPGTAIAQTQDAPAQNPPARNLQTQGAPADATTANAASPDAGAQPANEIVITGTSLRHVPPAGAEEITIAPAQIQATGVQSTDQLLATLPQLSSFGSLQVVNNGGTQLTVNRTNLRNLPQGIGGGSPTLILMDGHRLVGEGVKQSYPDPDVIPPALIDRVDVLTDGGSAIYGSDAVGGVINFVTRRNFDGIELGVRHGFGEQYSSTDVNFTAGKTWATGGAFVGYSFSYHSPLFSRDRDYVRSINYTTGLPTGQSCTPGNVVQGGANFAITGNSLVLSNANLCDTSKFGELFPRETRHSVLAGFHQELLSNVEFEIKGYYSRRVDTQDGGPLLSSAAVTSTNPNYISTGGGSTANQTVFFNFGPVGGLGKVSTKLWAYGITPTLTWKVGHDWQVRAYYNYGQSKTTANDPVVNSTVLGADVAAGTINPYNIAASNGSALAQVLNDIDYGIGRDTLSNAKVTADGPLFSLPGGDVRVAFGGEYVHEKFAGTVLTDTMQNVAIAPLKAASRNVKSGFGEINIPLIGPDNHFPLISSLTLSAAERYDDYSDFGHNWAPSLGVSLKPVKWINLRARWNRSFQAPSLVQLSQAGAPQASVFPGFLTQFVPLLLDPAVPFNGGPIVAVQGTVAPLQPQRARDYNLGFDISPPLGSGFGLDLHFTYFNINYSGQISAPPLGSGPFFGISSFNVLFIPTPTIAQVQTFLANAGVRASDIANTVATINAQGGNAYIVADIRARNLGVSLVRGIDVSADLRKDVSFGTIYASFNGSYTLKAVNAADGVTFAPDQSGIDFSALNWVGVLGAKVGQDFRGQVTWNHVSGFNLSAPAQLNQTRVAAFNTFDLFLQYDLKHNSLPPISLTLGVSNMFDTRPPLYRGTDISFGSGFAGAETLGRVVQLGASVKF